jgi:hypothetical protein
MRATFPGWGSDRPAGCRRRVDDHLTGPVIARRPATVFPLDKEGTRDDGIQFSSGRVCPKGAV